MTLCPIFQVDNSGSRPIQGLAGPGDTNPVAASSTVTVPFLSSSPHTLAHEPCGHCPRQQPEALVLGSFT